MKVFQTKTHIVNLAATCKSSMFSLLFAVYTHCFVWTTIDPDQCTYNIHQIIFQLTDSKGYEYKEGLGNEKVYLIILPNL